MLGLNSIRQKGGIGLLALYLVFLPIIGYYFGNSLLDQSISTGIVAAVPSFVVWAVSKQFNKKFVRIFETEKVAETFVRIKFHQGSKRFYNEYSGEVQDELDNLDEKFHNQVINILSGTVIACAVPLFAIVEFTEFSYSGIIVALGLAAVFAFGLGVASYKKMHELLEYSTQVTKVTDEA